MSHIIWVTLIIDDSYKKKLSDRSSFQPKIIKTWLFQILYFCFYLQKLQGIELESKILNNLFWTDAVVVCELCKSVLIVVSVFEKQCVCVWSVEIFRKIIYRYNSNISGKLTSKNAFKDFLCVCSSKQLWWKLSHFVIIFHEC